MVPHRAGCCLPEGWRSHGLDPVERHALASRAAHAMGKDHSASWYTFATEVIANIVHYATSWHMCGTTRPHNNTCYYATLREL